MDQATNRAGSWILSSECEDVGFSHQRKRTVMGVAVLQKNRTYSRSEDMKTPCLVTEAAISTSLI